MKKYTLIACLLLFTACSSESAPRQPEPPAAANPPAQSPSPADTIPPVKPRPDTLKTTPPPPDSAKPAEKPKPADPKSKPETTKTENTKPVTTKPATNTPQTQDAGTTTPKPVTTTPLPANQLQVVRVLGTVKNLSNGKTLRTRDKFQKSDRLSFASPNDRMALVDSKAGNFIAKPADTENGFKLEPTTASFNTRPGGITNLLVFRNYLNNRKLLVLGGETYIEVSTDAFPMNEGHFFYVQYKYPGESEPVNKKLSYSGRRMRLVKSELFQIDGQPVSAARASDFQLFYYSVSEENSLMISEFQPAFPNEQQLVEEVEVMVAGHRAAGSSRETMVEEVGSYLQQFYGKPEPANLEGWLKKNFGW